MTDPENPNSVSRPRASEIAVTSLALGVLAIPFGVCFPIPVFAVIFGHLARKGIREAGGGGWRMATAGLVLGYIGLVLTALIVVLSTMTSMELTAAP